MRVFKYGLMVVMVSSAHAGVLYSTSFESPTLFNGAIAGQDGWAVYGPGLSVVENFFAKTGSQAAFVDGGTASQSGPYHTDTNIGPLIELSADIAVFTSTTQSEFQFAAVGPGLSGFLGGIDILPDNSIQAISGAFPVIGTFARATAFDSTAWHHVDLLFNIPAQTYSITIDGILLASDLAFCGSNSGCSGANVGTYGEGLFDSFGGVNGNDSGYMDNFQVSALDPAPEPSSFLLIAGGLGMVLVGCRKLHVG